MDFLLPFPLLPFLPFQPWAEPAVTSRGSLGLICEAHPSRLRACFLLIEIGSTLLTLLLQQSPLPAEAPGHFKTYQVRDQGLDLLGWGCAPA